jgi:two-component system, NtrC family, nitrogen regulation sensor histidine kinase NtrY
MISSKIYKNIIFRVSMIVLTALSAAWAAETVHQWILFGVLMLLLCWEGYTLSHSLNEINRKIAFFFDAIRNEDTTLTFPETGNRSMNELSLSMNRLNLIIRDTKKQIRQQEQYYETILEHASTGLLSFDERGNILLTNSAARHLLNCEPLTHITQLERVEKGLSTVFEQMHHIDNKLINISNERGSLQLLLRSTLMMLKNKKIVLLSIQDIRNELDEKETASWIKLTRVLTHEIMNSIAPITSLSETLTGYFIGEKGPRPPEEMDKQTIANTIKGLTVIQERGKGLVNFVDAYRKLTHLPKPDCKMVDLHDFLEKAKLLLSSEPNFYRVGFSIAPIAEPIMLFIDENLFSQVIINLVRNSFQALNGQTDGVIKITTSKNTNGTITINIIDNGPGIPAEILDEIFVPFFTTRENGSGIGLSLSRQIIRLHGGNLKVISRQGVETIFSIEI